MSVNPSNTRTLSINKLIKLALRAARTVPAGMAETGIQYEKQAREARDWLDLAMKNLPTEGVLASATDIYEFEIVAGQASYEMPDGTVDVVGNAMFMAESDESTSAQTKVSPMDRNEYLMISTKTSEGRPTRFYPDKHADLTITLWPIPSENGTLTIQRQRYLSDADNGTYETGLQPWWYMYLVMATAHMIALSNSQPLEHVGYLRSQADRLLEKNKYQGGEKGPAQVYVGHETPWSC